MKNIAAFQKSRVHATKNGVKHIMLPLNACRHKWSGVEYISGVYELSI